MKARPIIFSAESVRAILAGTKTQTRRAVTPQPASGVRYRYRPGGRAVEDGHGRAINPPHGVPGDRLWIREGWCLAELQGGAPRYIPIYRADPYKYPYKWRSSMFMPRWASRITLEITDVRVQRLLDITSEDAMAEGATKRGPGWSMDWSRVGTLSRFAGGIHALGHEQPITEQDICLGSAKLAFFAMWEQLNGKRCCSWECNPWVWALTFRTMHVLTYAAEDSSGTTA